MCFTIRRVSCLRRRFKREGGYTAWEAGVQESRLEQKAHMLDKGSHIPSLYSIHRYIPSL